ncbi:MAG: hypothetical protein ACOH2H_09325 [Cypionkella sp.]
MEAIRSINDTQPTLLGFGVRVLLLSSYPDGGSMSRRLANLGGKIDVVDELFTALSYVIDDPLGYGLFVVDCDAASVGGLQAGKRAVQMMSGIVGRVPVILVAQECAEQIFPEDRMAPTQLRAPLSLVSLRVGFEHALRERLAYYP